MAEDHGKPPARPGDIHIHQGQVDGGASGVIIKQNIHVIAEAPASVETGFRCMAQPPEAFVPRHQLGALVALLCQAAAAAQQIEGASVGITTALRGAGGFGKTTLAQQLCFEPEVRRAYPDGILWVTMGEHVSETGRLGRVLDLIRWWSDKEPPAFTEVGPASAELRKRLAGKRVLVVVDDVWQSMDLMPFQGCDAGAAVLITTRDRRMLPRGCQEIEVDAMAQDESVALLSAGLPRDHAGALRSLAVHLGCWPLLLDLANRHLCDLMQYDGLTVPAAIAEVEQLLVDEGLTAFDLGDDDARRTAVEHTMAVSLRRLDEAERRRYEVLAVFPEDTDIPLSVLARLWSLSASAARKLCERLHGLSLLARFDRGAHTIRLHDVFRQYLIDRQRDAMSDLHRQWLDVFRPTSDRWHDLPPDDLYTWHHLAHHLRHAGQGGSLRGLLFDFAWLDSKLRATADVNALLADFAHAEPSLNGDSAARLLRDALRLSSHVLAVDAGQLPSQLVGRLGYFEESEADIGRLLEQTRRLARTPWLCPARPVLTAPGGALERTLEGHSNWINAVAVTPDGQRAISGSGDHTMRVWDLATGRLERTLKGHHDWVTAVAVTPDGQRAISASQDQTLRIWDLATGCLERTLEGHSSAITAVAVTPDGLCAISGSDDQTLRVWDLATGRPEHILEGHLRTVTAVAVTPDGLRAVSASRDRTLKVWHLTTGRLARILEGHSDAVTAVAVTPDGRRAISGSDDQTIKVWDLATGRPERILEGHLRTVTAVAVTPDGLRAVSASRDRTLKVWNLTTGRLEHTLEGHDNWISAVAVTPDSQHVVSASHDQTLKIWSLATRCSERTLEGRSGSVTAVAVTPDGQRAISASQDQTLRIWDLATGRLARTLQGHRGGVTAAAVMPDGLRAISGSDDQTLKVWDLATGRLMHTLTGHSGYITTVAVTPDGRYAISASGDKVLKVWNLATGRLERTLAGHTGYIRTITVTSDGRHAISGSDDRTLKVWNLTTNRLARTLEGHSGAVTAVAVTTDGRHAISGSDDQMLKIWDLATGRLARIIEGHHDWVTAVAVLPGGQCAISASGDKTLNVWNLDSGRAVATFTGDSAILCVAASDDKWIVAGDEFGRVHYFHLITEST